MKTIPLVLQTSDTLCTCLRIVRADAVELGFTTLDRALDVDGLTYNPGLNASSLASSSGLAVDNMELSLLGGDDEEAADLIAGRWNHSFFEVFETDYTAVPDSNGMPVSVLKRGYSGEVQLHRGKYVIELRGLTQALQQTQGAATQKTCRARFGGPGCTKDLGPFTHAGTLTGVTSKRVVTDSGRAEADGAFADGIIAFLTGPNAGYSQKVKLFSDGEFTLSLPLPSTPLVGDTYSAIEGCLKRLEDCIAKDNVLNFQGEPHLPGLDALSKSGAAETQPETTPEVPFPPVDTTGSGP